jgi:beta-lactam-binding protein with PASTA domain
MKDKEKQSFKAPTEKMAYGDQRRIPRVACESIGEARSELERAGFEVDVAQSRVPSSCPAGTVAGTSPEGRTIKGGVVVIEESNGAGANPDPSQSATPGLPGNPENGRPGGRPGGRPILPGRPPR